MKKILLIDTNFGFTADVESRMLLEDSDTFEIIIRNQADRVEDAIEAEKPDELLINANLLSSHPTWNFGIPVKTYAKDVEGVDQSHKKNIPCYGVIQMAGDLLSAIESNAVVSVSQVKEKKVTEKQKKEAVVKPEISASTPAQEPVKNEKQSSQVNPSDMSQFFAEHAEEFMKFMMQQAGGTPPVQEPAQPEKSVEPIEPEEFKQNAFPDKDINEKKNMEPAQDTAPETGMDIRSRMEAARKREEEENRRNQMAERKEQNEAMQQVEEDLGHVKKPAKVITVFSAKGGVGKTTIACELATFLSLTNHGKGKFRVCLVDYDLMFGDILSTLNFNPNQANMMDWIADLDKKHKAGQEWNAISYDAGQIERFLQKKEESGLYSLIAPITNFDYMKISNEEIVNLCGTMLRNIVENGDFDFVIVDTGNNIEDATYVSLERADEILLILTQSMNSANCNNNFLNTMNHLEFDLSKIRIVINKAKPAKGVGISVNELQEALKNPVTNQPFECYAKIKDNDAVQNAENVGEPMVYKSSHEFTKSIGEVAHHVIGDTFVLAKPKKKRFSFFRKNK
jgi:cellulose biosynthesis protein BcsQ